MNRRRRREGMTLLELMLVLVLIGLAASGLTFSLGALSRASLKSAAGRLASASRYAYNRAIVQGTTTRLAFELGGNTFSIEEAHGEVTLVRPDDERAADGDGEEGSKRSGAVDPWAAARSAVEDALQPNLGASPFGPITSATGKTLERYQNVELGRRVQIVRLIVGHEPEPRESGLGAVHYFPSGLTEHAVVQLTDGREGLYSVEIHPLTGRAHIYAKEYEPEALLDDPDKPDLSEVD